MHFAKTYFPKLTASFLLITTLVAPAFAISGTVNTGNTTLRVRTEANTESDVITKLDHGSEVEILATIENGWYQIAFGEHVGFVASDYLTVGDADGSVPAVPTQAPVDEPEVQYGKVTTSSLNVRSGPGTDYEKAGKLSSGKVVEILGESEGWYQIESGYVSAEFMIIVDADAANSSGKGQAIADSALSLVGCPYVYGGGSPKGFDCSGFAKYVYSQHGYSINRTASNQMDNGSSVSMNELEPGDLVFFKKSGSGSKRASHVGIYIGGGQFVHASTSRVGVIVSNMSDAYYTSGFVGGRRLA